MQDIRDAGSRPGKGRSPGEGDGNPLQYPCLENPTDWGAWWATVHGVTESDTAAATWQAGRHVMHTSLLLLSCAGLFVIPWTAARQASLSFTNSRRLLKLKSIGSVMSSSHLILCHPLLLLPSIFQAPFNLQGLFQRVGPSHRWPKYWSFSLGISPSSEYSGLISFSIDWFDLLAVQRPLKSLSRDHSSKASNL